jgi:WD domain, G-beta repeat/TIR domain
MPQISISYRRADSEAMTGRIFDRLIGHYGKEAIFRDIDNIPAGIDFRQHINEMLHRTNVLLAIVGPEWLGATRDGLERINEESDPVRVEVETALRRRLRIIPILIGQTRMPSSNQLPPSLKDFAFLNAVRIDTGRDFDHHIEHLIKSIDDILGQTKSPPSRETSIAGFGERSAAKTDNKTEKPSPAKVEAERKRDTGSRPAAATAAPSVAAAPRQPMWQGMTIPAPSRDWRYLLWPKSRSGRMLRLGIVGAVAVVLLALLVLDLWPTGPGAANMRRLFSLQNPGPVSALAFSPDAQEIAAASSDRSVNIWSVAGQKLLATLSSSDGISSVAFTLDGREVVFGGANGAIVIAYANAGGQIVRSLKPEGTYAWQAVVAISSIAVSPDGTRIVSGGDDGSVNIWSTDGQLLHSQKGHNDVVTTLAFFPDGKTFSSGSKDGTVRVWNTDSGSQSATLSDHSGPISSVAVSADGKLIAGAGSDNSVLIWNAASGSVARTLTSNLNAVNTVAFSPDGRNLFVGGDDASIEIWDVVSGQRLASLTGNSHGVRALAVSQDGSRLASGGDDKTIDVWSAE